MDASWIAAADAAHVQVRAKSRGRAGLDHRALIAIALCAVLPVLIGVLVATRSGPPDPPEVRSTAGHWVYVPDRGIAAHVDGADKRVDATVKVGSAGAGSPVLADGRIAYLVDDDRMIMFDHDGVTGDAPAAGAAEPPVPVEADGVAYLVYRSAGLIMRLGAKPVIARAGGPLAAPVVTPNGQLWTYRMDSRQLCVHTGGTKLSCPSRVPAGHTGALTVVDGRPGFLDLTERTWQALDLRKTDEPIALRVALPEDAAVGATSVGGQLAIVDRAEGNLLLITLAGDVTTVPLGEGKFSAPVSTGDAVAVVDPDAGTITSYDARGRRRAELTVPGDGVRMAISADGRGYADSADGLQSVVMDRDGALTAVHTTGDSPPAYQSPTSTPSVSLPPATVAVTTTETIPPVPETVTVEVTPPAETAPSPPVDGAPTEPGTTTEPPPGPGPGTPTVDVLSAEATGPGQATIQLSVSGAGPVFCHVYFNSVELAATKCEGTMTVVANGLAAGTTYDIYVLGTNANGTGVPGRRAVLQT